MAKIPLESGVCRILIIWRGMESEAKSQWIANVRGQIKELFLITISWGFVKIKFSWPLPLTLKETSFTDIVNKISDLEFCIRFFICSDMSLQPQDASTPTIQSPFNVRFGSVVISIVFGWSDLIFLWPWNKISKCMIAYLYRLKLNLQRYENWNATSSCRLW